MKRGTVEEGTEKASSSNLKGKATARIVFYHEGHEEPEVVKITAKQSFYHEEHEGLEG